MTIEKNDVDISKLFNWGKIFVLTNDVGDVKSTVYMRLAGDADINRARVYALRKSAELRKKLREESSDEKLAFIQDKELLNKERLVAILSGLSLRTITHQAMKETKLPFPKEPKSDATLEQFEKYQKEVDDYPEKKDKELRKFIEKELTKYKKTLERKSEDELYSSYVTEITNELCEQEMITSFREMCTFYGCYSDENFSERLFTNFEKFTNLNTDIKQQFLNAYQSLEMGTEELKKLQVATQ
jgi:hypothetical protein